MPTVILVMQRLWWVNFAVSTTVGVSDIRSIIGDEAADHTAKPGANDVDVGLER